MSSLLSGLAGSSWSRSSGLAASSQIALGDVAPQEIKRARGRSSLGMRAGRFALTISGVTKDATGAPLAGCTVKLFATATDLLEATAISDADGAYAFEVYAPFVAYYIVSYKAGAPDVAGTTLNTLGGA